MFNLRGLFLALIVALVATATTSAALSTLTMERAIELGLTNDSGETAVVRIENISDYSNEFMVEDGDGVVAFNLSEVIKNDTTGYDFNRDAQYTLQDNDGTELFSITNNSDVTVYVYIDAAQEGDLVLVGASSIAAGGSAEYHFTLDSQDVSLDSLTSSLHITTTQPVA